MRAVSVLRAASRTFQKTVVAVPRSARLSPALARSFTTTPKSFSAVTTQLTEALNNEIKAEKQLEAENLGGAKAPTVPGFTVTTKEADVVLTKTHGTEKIRVYFNVNHSVNMDEEFEGQEETEPVPVALPPLDVEITKGNQRFCFHLDLVHAEEEGQFDYSVAEFYVAPIGTEADDSVPDHVYASSGKYIDPTLHDLLFVQYLEERGFTQQFCQDVVHYATHYEHSQYVSLLDRIKSFVSKP
ncbi:hypothetical protein QR680_012419 [Steinernema hermaphroditum]|uniref:Complement component 1 Q subcomponent-binding protein, mitochondrial n=1 Tax=Steinernema hermaphroditum TaxID=289476 RepID=A0AA39M0H4_9BILA|nr:hypothetical protein QR680_012419 [Steinernema hermaphroditum]